MVVLWVVVVFSGTGVVVEVLAVVVVVVVGALVEVDGAVEVSIGFIDSPSLSGATSFSNRDSVSSWW